MRIGNKDYVGKALIARISKLKVAYGVTVVEYNRMFDAQEGLCACCNDPEYTKQLAVDHCHVTGRVRALLCHQCNNNLGIYEKWGARYAAYLEKVNAKNMG